MRSSEHGNHLFGCAGILTKRLNPCTPPSFPKNRHSSISNSSTYHADGDKWADHGGSALPFKNRRIAVGQPYHFLQQSKINIQHSSIGNSSTYHADGDKWADRGGSALPF
jgi:hypothetical protein